MKTSLLISILIPILGLTQPRGTSLKVVNDTLQHLSLKIPSDWKYDGSVIYNGKLKKVGEIIGFIDDCTFKSHSDYLKQVRKGYVDDPSAKFVGSDTFNVNKLHWTRAVRTIEMWDGKGGVEKAFSHEYFTFLKRKCFQIIFYSKQRTPAEIATYKQILSTIESL